MVENIGKLKDNQDLIGDYGPDDIIQKSEQLGLALPECMGLTRSNKMVIPSKLNTNFFCFCASTAKQNGDISLQMDGIKFVQSMKAMLLQSLAAIPNDKHIFIQLDNATYHRQAEDDTLQKSKE